MIHRIAFLHSLATLCLCTSALAADLRTTEVISTAPRTTYMAVDSVSGRLFTSDLPAYWADGRGSVTVLETVGTKRTFPMSDGPLDVAIGTASRKVVVTQVNGSRVTVFDADTLATRTFPTGPQPFKAVVVDSLDRAYVIGQTSQADPGFRPGDWEFSGSLTEIDFATGGTRTVAIPGFRPSMVVSNGSKVYMVGVELQFAAEAPAFIQAFDIASGTLGPVMALGRRPLELTMSTSGQEVYLLGHAEATRIPPGRTEPEPSVRAALFVVDAESLATKRTVLLPEYTVTNFDGVLVYNLPNIVGAATIDPQSGNVYALDSYNRQFSIVDAATGGITRIGTEGVAATLAFDPVHRNLYLNFSYDHYVGVYSPEGVRLDTVATTVPTQDKPSFTHSMVVDGRTGVAFISNPVEGSVTVLRTPGTVEATELFNATDVWWNPAESGWGLYVEQQGVTMFGALFARDAAGNPSWYVMSDGKRVGDGSFRGTLYRTQGPTAAGPMRATPVGAMAFVPDAAGGAYLWYSVDGAIKTSSVKRLAFAAERSCGWSESPEIKAGNFTSLWYQPENAGWGLAASQRGDAMFGVLFGYDAANQPTWSVMSNGTRTAGNAFGGELHRPSGAGMASLGTMAIEFGGNTAMLSTVTAGKSSALPVKRQVFSPLTSACN